MRPQRPNEVNTKYKSPDVFFVSGIEKIIQDNGYIVPRSEGAKYSPRDLCKRLVQDVLTEKTGITVESAIPYFLRGNGWNLDINFEPKNRQKFALDIVKQAQILNSLIDDGTIGDKSVYWDKDSSSFTLFPSGNSCYEVILKNTYNREDHNRNFFTLFQDIKEHTRGQKSKDLKFSYDLNFKNEQGRVFLEALRLVMLGASKEELDEIVKELGLTNSERVTKVENRETKSELNQKLSDQFHKFQNQLIRREDNIYDVRGPFRTGRNGKLLWQKVSYGGEAESNSENAFRGYLMINPPDIPKALDILSRIGKDLKGKYPQIPFLEFKWLMAFDERGNLDEENIGTYNNLEPTAPAVAIYGDNLKQIQDILFIISQQPEWPEINNNRVKGYTGRNSPRRPGTNSFVLNPPAGSQKPPIEIRSLNFNSKPGYSEDEVKLLGNDYWRDFKQGLPTGNPYEN